MIEQSGDKGKNMPRNAPGLMPSLTAERIAPRQVREPVAQTPPAAASPPTKSTPAPKRGEPGWKQPNRQGKVPISAFVEKQTLFNLKAFLAGTVSAAKQESVTMQDAIIEALRDYCIKYKLQGDPTKFVQ